MKTVKLVSPALAVLLLLCAGSVSAYVTWSPARTWSCPPYFTVDNRAGGVPSIADGDGGATRIVNAITASVAWNGAASGLVLKANKASIAGFALGDNLPMINLTDPLSACTGSCVAATFIGSFHERSAGSGSWQIDDADIVTNSTGYNWTSQGEDPGGVGCSGEIYIEGVMVHEVGHGLGFAHSPVTGATMAGPVAFCNNNKASTEADDENGLAALYGTSPCASCEAFTNYMPSAGLSHYQPCGGTYIGEAGLQIGHLRGPAGADFDLYLSTLNNGQWVIVAQAMGNSSNEDISYNGAAGYYRWIVHSFSGTGAYHFYTKHP
jgi:hypothetical protein